MQRSCYSTIVRLRLVTPLYRGVKRGVTLFNGSRLLDEPFSLKLEIPFKQAAAFAESIHSTGSHASIGSLSGALGLV